MIRLLRATGLGLALLTAGVAPAFAQQPAAAAAPSAFTPTQVSLPSPDGRTIDLSVWQAEHERGVIVFSHGWNSRPESYHRILRYWVEHGFTVVAPLHTDSLQHPRHAEGNNQTFFITRVVDMAVTRGFVQMAHAGKPMIAAGHSFGSLMSLIGAGAVTVAGPQGDPAIKAVVALSSPGNVPGLVNPQTFAAVSAPVLMITGDADLVPGFVTDPRDHRTAFDTSLPGDKMLLTFADGDHSLVGNADAADFDLIASTTLDFMRAHALDDAAAAARLHALTAPEGVTIERR
jgi:alpha-beta hydrolase superfamily lysophospholipase